MKAGDRFHRIMVSDDIAFENDPAVAVLACFSIRRATGVFDIVFVHKTYRGEEVVGKSVQEKTGISHQRIEDELVQVRTAFTGAIESLTGISVTWNVLDLSRAQNDAEHIRMIREYGCFNVFVAPSDRAESS